MREDWEGEAGRGGCRRASIFPPHISSSLISPPHPFSFLLLPSLQPSLLLHILPPPPTSSLLQWRPMKANGIQWSPTDSNGALRPHEANPACSGGACGIRFMGGGRGPMKRFPHARGAKVQKHRKNKKKQKNQKKQSWGTFRPPPLRSPPGLFFLVFFFSFFFAFPCDFGFSPPEHAGIASWCRGLPP